MRRGFATPGGFVGKREGEMARSSVANYCGCAIEILSLSGEKPGLCDKSRSSTKDSGRNPVFEILRSTLKSAIIHHRCLILASSLLKAALLLYKHLVYHLLYAVLFPLLQLALYLVQFDK
jgi:hypothetical protein